MRSSRTPVQRWRRGALRPEMTIHTDTDGASALEVIAAALTSAGLRVHDRCPEGFLARRSPRRDRLTLNPSERMTLLVHVTDDGATIAAPCTGRGTAPARFAARGINAALDELGRRGISATWTQWRDQRQR